MKTSYKCAFNFHEVTYIIFKSGWLVSNLNLDILFFFAECDHCALI